MVELNPTIFLCNGYTDLHLITKVSMHKVESNFQENNVITKSLKMTVSIEDCNVEC